MTIGIHTREIHDRIIYPMIKAGSMMSVFDHNTNTLNYRVFKPMRCLTCKEPFTDHIRCECGR